MSATSFDGIVLPDDDLVPIAEVQRFLEQQGESGCFLVGAGGRVPVPPELAEVIRQAVDTFRYNQAVDMTSLPLTVTVDQAAPKLRARADQVEEMLDAGTLPFEQGERGRRIPLRDLLAYLRRRREQWYEFVAEDMYADGGVVTDQDRENMRRTRREIYEEKKRRSDGRD